MQCDIKMAIESETILVNTAAMGEYMWLLGLLYVFCKDRFLAMKESNDFDKHTCTASNLCPYKEC